MKKRLQKEKRGYIIQGALGHSLMVEHRTLTPLVLVRIQLPQPRNSNTRMGVLIFGSGSDG